jgi:hypothetical protein
MIRIAMIGAGFGAQHPKVQIGADACDILKINPYYWVSQIFSNERSENLLIEQT